MCRGRENIQTEWESAEHMNFYIRKFKIHSSDPFPIFFMPHTKNKPIFFLLEHKKCNPFYYTKPQLLYRYILWIKELWLYECVCCDCDCLWCWCDSMTNKTEPFISLTDKFFVFQTKEMLKRNPFIMPSVSSLTFHFRIYESNTHSPLHNSHICFTMFVGFNGIGMAATKQNESNIKLFTFNEIGIGYERRWTMLNDDDELKWRCLYLY